jgi:arsenite methyltransferase
MSNYLSSCLDLNDPELINVIDELPLWSAPFGLKLLDTVEMKKNIKVLDIGCGMGFPVLELAQRLGDSSVICAVDPWENALERVRLKMKMYQIMNVELFNAVAEKMPFENNYFDLIISNNGLNNVNNLELSLKECARVSKVSSQLVFTVNLEESMIEFYKIFEEVLRTNGLTGEIIKMKEHIHSKRKPVDEMKKLLENNNYVIKDIILDKFTMRYADGASFLNHFFIRLAFMDPWKKVLNERDLEKVFGEIENKMNEFAVKNGEVRITIPFATFDCRRV